jgi:hypothetical protein
MSPPRPNPPFPQGRTNRDLPIRQQDLAVFRRKLQACAMLIISSHDDDVLGATYDLKYYDLTAGSLSKSPFSAP